MTKSEKQKALGTNSLLWLPAIILPAVLHFAFASSFFPWPLLLPFLLLGPMMVPNQILAKAIGEPIEGKPETETKLGD